MQSKKKLLRNIRALEKSALKWENVFIGTGIDDSVRNCALCSIYFENGCRGCPIFEITGKAGCENTPYADWADHHHNDHNSSTYRLIEGCKKCEKLAFAEWKFLYDLYLEKLNEYYET